MDILVEHHWFDKDGHYQYALICRSCNTILSEWRVNQIFGGFPPRDIQKLFIQSYKKYQNNLGEVANSTVRVIRNEVEKERDKLREELKILRALWNRNEVFVSDLFKTWDEKYLKKLKRLRSSQSLLDIEWTLRADYEDSLKERSPKYKDLQSRLYSIPPLELAENDYDYDQAWDRYREEEALVVKTFKESLLTGAKDLGYEVIPIDESHYRLKKEN